MQIKNTIALIAALFLLWNVQSNAQITFQKTFGGADDDWGSSVQQTSDGGYILGGTTWSYGTGQSDFYLIKTDASGDTLWTKTYGGYYRDDCYSMQQTTDGGYVMLGLYDEDPLWGWNTSYMIRADANGDTLWTRFFVGDSLDYGNKVQQTSDLGFITAGESSFTWGDDVCTMIRTDAAGDTLWIKIYDVEWNVKEGGNSVQQTTDGGYIMTGYVMDSTNTVGDIFLLKTDSDGDTLWTKLFDGNLNEVGNSVVQTLDGGYAILGESNSFGGGDDDVYLIKTDTDGDLLWGKVYGGSGDDYGFDLKQTADSGFIIVGETNSFGMGATDVYLIRTDANGDTIWTRTFGGTGSDYGESVDQTTDGGFIITGGTNSFGAGFDDVYMIKTDADGNTGCNQSGT